jgi:hypothetical protein
MELAGNATFEAFLMPKGGFSRQKSNYGKDLNMASLCDQRAS